MKSLRVVEILTRAAALASLFAGCSTEPPSADRTPEYDDGGLAVREDGLAGCTRYNEEHLDRLLRTNACAACCLKGAYLERAPLPGADLRGSDLSCARLSGANLSGASLWGSDLRGADLSNAYLPAGGRRDIPGTPATLVCPNHEHTVRPNQRFASQLPPARCNGRGAPLYESAGGPPSALVGALPAGARVRIFAPDTAYQRAKVQVVSGGCDPSLRGRQGWVSYTHLLAN